MTYTGGSPEKGAVAEAFLAGCGYRIAPFTIENPDVIFNVIYVQALAEADPERPDERGVLPGMKEEPESLTAESADEVEEVLIEPLGFLHVQEVPSSHHHHLSGICHGLIEQIGDLETRRDVVLGRQDESGHADLADALGGPWFEGASRVRVGPAPPRVVARDTSELRARRRVTDRRREERRLHPRVDGGCGSPLRERRSNRIHLCIHALSGR
jgi:hypothetical protein